MSAIKPIAKGIADFLAGGGVYLSAKPNSFFQPITSALVEPIDVKTVDSVEALVAKTNKHFEVAKANPFAPVVSIEEDAVVLGSTLGAVNTAAIAELTPIVTSIIERLRSVVVPTTTEIFEKAFSLTQESVNSGGIKLSIKTNGSELPVWNNPTLHSLLKEAQPTSADGEVINGQVSFPHLATEEIANLIKTGDDYLDAEVEQLLGTVSRVEALEAAYHRAFNVPADTLHPVQCPMIHSLLVYLMAARFTQDVPEGVTGVDLDDYRAFILRVVNYHGTRLVSTLEKWAGYVKNDYMVVSYPEQGSEFREGEAIVVHGVLFNRWMEQGGSVDAVYGAYISATQLRRSMDILEASPELTKNWYRHIAYQQSALRDDFQRIFTQALRREIYVYAKESGAEVNQEGIEAIFERTSALTSDNAFQFARRCIIRTLFNDGEYLAIVENIDAVTQKYQDIGFDEALEMAIIDWLVKWALTQVKVVNG